MNNKELEQLFSSYQQDFDPFFSTRVLARMERATSSWLNWKWLSPALGLAAVCLAILFVQDGGLTVDGLLGVSEYETDLNNYLMYF